MFDQPPPGPPEGIEKLKDVEFEVFREEWNEYRLEDGTLIRNRVIMLKIMVDPEATESEKQFTLKPRLLTTAVTVPSHLKGTPDRTVYPPPELLEDSQRLDFDTIEDSEHSSDEDELPKTEIFTGGYSIGKENEE